MKSYPCIICQSTEFELVYPSTLPAKKNDIGVRFRCTSDSYGIHDDILRCSQCGLLYNVPSYSAEQLVEHYAGIDDPVYLAERQGRVLTFRRHLRSIQRLLEPGHYRLLDVGCHIGIFVAIAQQAGWDAWGVEPSQWAAGYARQQGLQVLPTTVAGAEFEPDSFDIVTLWDVIEHLADPVAELQAIHRILKPNGLLVIHTINAESLLARLMGARWPWLMEMHRFYFSPRTLGLMLANAGFAQFQTRTQGRYLRLGYLLSRLVPYTPRLGALLQRTAKALHLGGLPIPINFGDLFTSFARRNPDRRQEGS